MRILLDVDGVIADLVGDLCTYLRDRQPSHFTEYNFADVLNAEETKRVHSLMRAPGFCAGLPWYEGAQKFVAALQTMGEVIAVTKPFARGPTWAFERTNWLKPYVADVVHTDRKSLVAGDILIEDSTHNAEEWLYAHPSGLAILIDRPWNYKLLFGATRLLRAHSYTECLSILRYDIALIQAAGAA